MKKLTVFAALLAATAWLAPKAWAETTVTVNDGKTTVSQGTPSSGVVVQQQPAAQVIEPRVIAVGTKKDVDVSGRIVAVDAAKHEIIVRDEMPHDRRIVGDPGIVSTLKVGDYVDVRMRHGSDTEAFRILER